MTWRKYSTTQVAVIDFGRSMKTGAWIRLDALSPVHAENRYRTPGGPVCRTVARAIALVRASYQHEASLHDTPPYALVRVRKNCWTNVAVRTRGPVTTNEWDCPPPSLHERHTNRSPVVTDCGEGATTEWELPSSHQNVCGSAYRTPSTTACLPAGEDSMTTRCSATNMAL